jgi:hypothetical protein
MLRSIACGFSLPIQTSYLALVVLPWLTFVLRVFLGFRSVFLVLVSVRSCQLAACAYNGVIVNGDAVYAALHEKLRNQAG